MNRAAAGARPRSASAGAHASVHAHPGAPAGVHPGARSGIAARRHPAAPAGEAARPTGLIEGYRAIERVAGEMLRAGRAGDWPAVRDLGATIRDLGDGVTQAGGPAALTPEQRRERMRILKRLIVLDGELRHLSDPMAGWLDTMFARPTPVTPGAHRGADGA